ncbi:LOW QUALITY PROTEIN: U2 small nuclear ribonucleoprotein auxiliary factor 35 kDa subunit-related protein 1 [Drosophila eugracilis]|uniref:LOW QUALITY PROTEIN: U2 small nuclear ribonucleoprotein auxiliary factor 35 kDa subunit-related protein 1 n=1 Tax=Drosophila eugracilis TaxID=29029 RepID=UPI001BD936DD|nr:LOW QUALITY PROTEIN: U2 small nuclear ribonucleoprotein auxiliary factor 35 kDa subunit-related protein 1 [Drosophila eugracilis]
MPDKRARRKLIKKQQRKRRRQKQAKERDKLEEEAENQRLLQPEYQKWLQEQREMEEFQRLAEQREHQDAEEAWLRREAIAQRQFRIDEAKRLQEQEEVERLQREQAKERLEREEIKRKLRKEEMAKSAKAAAEFDAMMESMNGYLNNPRIENPPSHLLRVMETHPEERLCEFFTRTNCCRYGHACTFNHRRPLLARILLIRHFFKHSMLQEHRPHKEYDSAEEHLEFTEQDLRRDYDEFFNDTVEELEKFGTIVNFRTVRNTLEHLRGHVFVQYTNERSALRAFTNLQGRYYASKRLNVEFSNLKTWRGAVCGLSLTRKCPKGNGCGYLHLFRNPNNLFNTELESTTTPRRESRSSQTATVKTPSWDDQNKRGRNWRWSESPEVELENFKDVGNSLKNSNRRQDLKISHHREYKARSRSDKDSKRSNRDESSKRKRSSSRTSHDDHRSSRNHSSSSRSHSTTPHRQ